MSPGQTRSIRLNELRQLFLREHTKSGGDINQAYQAMRNKAYSMAAKGTAEGYIAEVLRSVSK